MFTVCLCVLTGSKRQVFFYPVKYQPPRYKRESHLVVKESYYFLIWKGYAKWFDISIAINWTSQTGSLVSQTCYMHANKWETFCFIIEKNRSNCSFDKNYLHYHYLCNPSLSWGSSNEVGAGFAFFSTSTTNIFIYLPHLFKNYSLIPQMLHLYTKFSII